MLELIRKNITAYDVSAEQLEEVGSTKLWPIPSDSVLIRTSDFDRTFFTNEHAATLIGEQFGGSEMQAALLEEFTPLNLPSDYTDADADKAHKEISIDPELMKDVHFSNSTLANDLFFTTLPRAAAERLGLTIKQGLPEPELSAQASAATHQGSGLKGGEKERPGFGRGGDGVVDGTLRSLG